MAASAVWRCYNFRALREACGPRMAAIAAEIAASAAANTPRDTGTLAGSYATRPGDRDPGTYLVTASDVAHGKYVEYGTRRRPASAPLGRAVAAARARYG
jgi:Bacteriophage HK97-gp10, putative tail-component